MATDENGEGSMPSGANVKLREVHRFVRPYAIKSVRGGVAREEERDESDASGFWLRRRRIDGALNRAPPEFYAKIWHVLRHCDGLSIHGHVLHAGLTNEMTTEELKFALTVEAVLNRVPEPEYRQLLVEAMMVATIVTENHTNLRLGPRVLALEYVIREANRIFLEDQARESGDATQCCARQPYAVNCGGVHGVCCHFYDSPPSGRYGTITYLCRALVSVLDHRAQDIECAVS